MGKAKKSKKSSRKVKKPVPKKFKNGLKKEVLEPHEKVHQIMAESDKHGPMYDVVVKADGTNVINLTRQFNDRKPEWVKRCIEQGATNLAKAVEGLSVTKSIASGMTCSAGPLQQQGIIQQRKVKDEFAAFFGVELQSISPVLTDMAAAVLELLRSLPEHRALKGYEIIDRIEKEKEIIISPSTLTKDIIPVLKEHYGVENAPRKGYYIRK